MSLKSVWDAAKNYMRDDLTANVYQTYIEELTPVFYNEKTNLLVIKASQEHVRIMLESKYSILIDRAVKFAYGGKEVNVKLIVNENELEDMPDYKDVRIGDSYKERYNPEPIYSTATDMSRFNPKYTFDTFVVGSNNRLAHAAALAVAQYPAKKYNPFFIYGGVGLGKTHLMQAIAQEVIKNSPDFKVVYVSSETFTHEFIDAIRRESNIQFRNKYRNVDMLLIDDVQFLSGKEGTQEEFFHTFNELHMAGKQIILTSDKPPKEIPELEERLRSRFEWGLSCDIAPPNFETRIAILKKKAEEENMEIPNENEVFEIIAQNVISNIRELEGVLLKFKAVCEVKMEYGEEITRDDILSIVTDIVPTVNKKITVETIIKVVSKFYDVSYADILSKKRTSNVAKARQVGVYLTRELTDLSQEAIGSSFGGRDHSTVVHSHKKISEQVKTDISFQKEIQGLIQDIKNENY